MNNRIQSQWSKFWNLISDPATANVYKQAGAVTWTILREAGILVWLVICLVLVVFDWFWTNSIWAGQRTRAWVNDITSTSGDRLPSEAGKAILTVSKTGFASAIAQAREQLGLSQRQTPLLEGADGNSSNHSNVTSTASGPAAPATSFDPVKPSIPAPADIEQLAPSVRAEVKPATTPEESQDDLL